MTLTATAVRSTKDIVVKSLAMKYPVMITALRNLKKDPTRIVTTADKGNSLVVLDRSDYD